MAKLASLTLGLFALVAAESAAYADQIDVTPSNPDGWSFSNTDNSGTNASGDFELGMSTPPLGDGSARFIVNDASSSEILIKGLTPETVGSLTGLTYSTFVTTSTLGSGSAPTLQFDLFEGTTYAGRLVFDPGLLGTVTDGDWQSWDASTEDAWYFSKPSVVGNGCLISGPSTYCTFAQAAGILDDEGIDLVDVLFKAGSGQPSFDGNVDALTLNGTTYNFDPDPVPEPVSLSLFGAGLAGAAAFRRRQKAKQA